MGTTKRITFGRLEPISELPGEDKCGVIFHGDEQVGEVDAIMVDVGATSSVHRVGSYYVEVEVPGTDGDEVKEATFRTTNGGGRLEARAAHMAAKDFARRVLAGEADDAKERGARSVVCLVQSSDAGTDAGAVSMFEATLIALATTATGIETAARQLAFALFADQLVWDWIYGDHALACTKGTTDGDAFTSVFGRQPTPEEFGRFQVAWNLAIDRGFVTVRAFKDRIELATRHDDAHASAAIDRVVDLILANVAQHLGVEHHDDDPRSCCKCCGNRMAMERTPDDPDGVYCDSTTRPGTCGGCAGHLDGMDGTGGATIHTNESHDPADWTWA